MKANSAASPMAHVSCKICQTKRARRACPGVEGDICPSCCGIQREVTIDCPLDCEYLREARQHETPPPFDPATLPNMDVRVTEEFMREQEHLFLYLGHQLTRAIEAAKAVDSDAREALEAIIKTYRTAESGLIYESRPANPCAAGIQDAMKAAIEDLRKRVAEATGSDSIRDADILGVLVFLQRLEYQNSNGRRRGRAFLHFLSQHFAPPQAEKPVTA